MNDFAACLAMFFVTLLGREELELEIETEYERSLRLLKEGAFGPGGKKK